MIVFHIELLFSFSLLLPPPTLKHVFTSFPNLHSPVVQICTRQHRCSSVMGLWKGVPERENERRIREGRKKTWREGEKMVKLVKCN